jgi:hypothetical protein
MNCREAQSQIFAERDGALDNNQRAALEGHVASCAACRRVRDDFSAALTAWRNETANAPVPDAEREWHAVRRRIRGGAELGTAAAARSRRSLFPWLALPLGAAAALIVALSVAPSNTDAPRGGGSVSPPANQVARAESVEVPGRASTMVFVDDKSGWLFVQASDTIAKL